MQHRALLSDVDLVAAKHGFNARLQAGLTRQFDKQLQGLVGDAILRVVEKQAQGIDGQALARAPDRPRKDRANAMRRPAHSGFRAPSRPWTE
jgi:hypothetical protein